MNKLQKDQLLYLAGFIDGDGSIFAQIIKKSDYLTEAPSHLTPASVFTRRKPCKMHLCSKNTLFAAQKCIKRPKFRIRVTVQLTQLKQRKWFLEKWLKIIGAGYVRDRGLMSDYVLTETANVYSLLKQLQPFLDIKQKQANLILNIIEQLPSIKDSQDKFLELCKLVDHVALLNDSKKRINTAETVKATLKGSNNVVVPVETSDIN